MVRSARNAAARGSRAVTPRALIVGILGAVLVNAWPTWSAYAVRSTWADFGQITLAVLLPYVVLGVAGNALVRRAWPRAALSGGEVLVAFMIAMVAATMQGEGLTGYFLGVVTAPNYFASPENAWSEHIVRHAPQWLLVGREGNALRHFYEGLPPGRSMTWHPFVVPVLWWSTFFAGLYLLCCFVAVLLRKQWMEYERLAYPLARMPMLLVGRSRGRGWLPDVARSRLFWIGAAVPFGIVCWNIVSWFAPGFPTLPLLERFAVFPQIQFARGFPALHAKVDFFVMSFAYLTSTEILFSIWFFHLLSVFQVGVMNRLGLSIGPADEWCSWDAATGWQSLGGFMVFVVWGLWRARRHLAAAARKALTGRGPLDDADEIVPYRTAFFGSVACTGFCIVWLVRAGMSWPVAATFIVVLLLSYIGIAKIAATSGLVYLRGPVTPQAMVWHLFGTANLTPGSMVGIGLTYTFFCDAKGWMMTPFVHLVRIAKGEGIGGRRGRRLFAGVGLGSLLGAATAILLVLALSLGVGAYHFGVATFQWSHILIWQTVATRVKESAATPFGTDWARLSFSGGGAAFTAGLIALRSRFPWWPLHPVGFAVSSCYPIRDSAFGVFLVWVLKVALLRLGGLRLYRRAIPLFVGMLVGYVLAVGLGFAVDCICFPGAGHHFHGF